MLAMCGKSDFEKSAHKRHLGALEKDSDNINYCLFCWLPHRSTDFFVPPVISANMSGQGLTIVWRYIVLRVPKICFNQLG